MSAQQQEPAPPRAAQGRTAFVPAVLLYGVRSGGEVSGGFGTPFAVFPSGGRAPGPYIVANLYRRRLKVEEVKRKVAAYYGLSIADLESARRDGFVARARQVAVSMARQLTGRSFAEIGRRFGGRDHSTMIHAVRRIEALRRDDPELDGDLRFITRELVG